MQQVIHYPNLKTVIMVEEALKRADAPLSREELKALLPTQVMHQTLNVILSYLEESGKIIDHKQGIVWTHNDNQRFAELLQHTVRVKPEMFRVPAGRGHKPRTTKRRHETSHRRSDARRGSGNRTSR